MQVVADLIDGTNHCWKQEVIHRLFDQATSTKILAIRIPQQCEDKLIWTLTRNGDFTVKSAYNTLYNIKYKKEYNHRPCSNNYWQKIWDLDTIPRVQMFIWKCVKDIISSKERNDRHVHIEDLKCDRCKHPLETAKHIILDCPIARMIWFQTIGLRTSGGSWNSLRQWIIEWLEDDDLDDAQKAKMAIIAWHLWKERCSMVFDQKTSSPDSLLSTINSFLVNADSAKARKQTLRQSVQSNNNKHAWTKPNSDCIKINCDASFSNRNKHGGIGLIARDSAGTHLGSKCLFIREAVDAEEVECLATEKALEWAASRGWRKVLFESDVERVVKAIKGTSSTVAWQYRGVIEDIAFSLSNFSISSFSYANRLANNCADALAKHARKNSVSDSWSDVPPEFLSHFLLSDSSSSS